MTDQKTIVIRAFEKSLNRLLSTEIVSCHVGNSMNYNEHAQQPGLPATPINYVVPTPTPITAFGGPTPTAAFSPFYQPSGTRNISPTVPSYPKTALQANRIIPTSPSAFGNKNDIDDEFSAIPGVPGVDYPVFEQTPRTTFDCRQQLPGYYADVEARCQVFHICASNRTYSFLCPNGTIFSQETLVCVWWNQFDCNLAPSLYENNAFIYDYSQTGSGRFCYTKIPFIE
uniref:Chitin-binding type-2 domain-containing protein n=1 Tax=Megaselia scalaris TaxID=36166 RepID=T1GL90_MEGSC